MAATHGIENERLREIAPTFVGRTLDDVAKDNGLTPGSLRARFSTDGYDVKIRKGVIEEIALPYRVVTPPEKPTVKVVAPVLEIKAKPKKIPYKEPTRIVLPSDEYFEMIAYFRSRNHRRCRS